MDFPNETEPDFDKNIFGTPRAHFFRPKFSQKLTFLYFCVKITLIIQVGPSKCHDIKVVLHEIRDGKKEKLSALRDRDWGAITLPTHGGRTTGNLESYHLRQSFSSVEVENEESEFAEMSDFALLLFKVVAHQYR